MNSNHKKTIILTFSANGLSSSHADSHDLTEGEGGGLGFGTSLDERREEEDETPIEGF